MELLQWTTVDTKHPDTITETLLKNIKTSRNCEPFAPKTWSVIHLVIIKSKKLSIELSKVFQSKAARLHTFKKQIIKK